MDGRGGERGRGGDVRGRRVLCRRRQRGGEQVLPFLERRRTHDDEIRVAAARIGVKRDPRIINRARQDRIGSRRTMSPGQAAKRRGVSVGPGTMGCHVEHGALNEQDRPSTVSAGLRPRPACRRMRLAGIEHPQEPGYDLGKAPCPRCPCPHIAPHAHGATATPSGGDRRLIRQGHAGHCSLPARSARWPWGCRVRHRPGFHAPIDDPGIGRACHSLPGDGIGARRAGPPLPIVRRDARSRIPGSIRTSPMTISADCKRRALAGDEFQGTGIGV